MAGTLITRSLFNFIVKQVMLTAKTMCVCLKTNYEAGWLPGRGELAAFMIT